MKCYPTHFSWHFSSPITHCACMIGKCYVRSSFRSSRLQILFKIGAPKNFAILTGKHLCWSLFLGLKACNFIKKRLQHRCFPVNIAKFLRTAFSIEHLWWLLLFNTISNFAAWDNISLKILKVMNIEISKEVVLN